MQQDRHEALLKAHPALLSEVSRRSTKCCQAYIAALRQAVAEQQESAVEGLVHMVRVSSLPSGALADLLRSKPFKSADITRQQKQ